MIATTVAAEVAHYSLSSISGKLSNERHFPLSYKPSGTAHLVTRCSCRYDRFWDTGVATDGTPRASGSSPENSSPLNKRSSAVRCLPVIAGNVIGFESLHRHSSKLSHAYSSSDRANMPMALFPREAFHCHPKTLLAFPLRHRDAVVMRLKKIQTHTGVRVLLKKCEPRFTSEQRPYDQFIASDPRTQGSHYLTDPRTRGWH